MPALLSVGQLIDHSWEHYRHKFIQLMSVSAWLLVTALFGTVSLALYPDASALLLATHHYTSTETFAVLLWIVNSLIVAPVIASWLFLTIARLIQTQMQEKRVNLAQLGRESWKLFWPLVLVSAQVLLMLAAPWLLTVPGIILMLLSSHVTAGAWLGGLLIVAGLLAGTVLSIRWFVYYSYAPYALALENLRGKAALSRARGLVQGRFWATLIRMVLPKIVFMAVLLVSEALLSQLLDSPIRTSAGLNLDLYLRISGIVNLLIGTIGAVLINPLLLTTDYLVYVSLKETHEA